jgi:hypothetical protein
MKYSPWFSGLGDWHGAINPNPEKFTVMKPRRRPKTDPHRIVAPVKKKKISLHVRYKKI